MPDRHIILELEEPPSMGPMLAKVAVRALPIPGRGGGDGDAELPDTTVVLKGAEVDPAHVAAYADVCGFRLGDTLPVTYPHMLGFPLSVQLMTRPDFPFALMGMVHVRNTITSHRPVALEEPLDLTAAVTTLRPHPKGMQMDNVVTAQIDGETVWSSTSTYLARGSGQAGRGEDPRAGESMHPADDIDVADLPVTAQWRVPADIGRRYGRVSGDRNPIHLTALTARPFGFPRAIAHGMWTKARCLAALEGRLPDACTVDVAFKRPLLLPSTVQYCTRQIGDGWAFGVRDRDGRPHVAGLMIPLP